MHSPHHIHSYARPHTHSHIDGIGCKIMDPIRYIFSTLVFLGSVFLVCAVRATVRIWI